MGGSEGGGGVGGSGRGIRVRDIYVDRGGGVYVEGNYIYGATGHVTLSEGCGVGTGSLPGGTSDVRVHVEGGVYDPQKGGEGGVQRHRLSGGVVEVFDGDPKFLPHRLHHLPKIPPRIPVSLRYRYGLPRCQTTTSVNNHEEVGPVFNIFRPAQGA